MVVSGASSLLAADNGIYLGAAHTIDATSSGGSQLVFGEWHRTAATIDSSGRLGVNNSSPGDLAAAANNLVVGSGSGNEGLTIFAASDSEASIYFADGTTGNEAYRSYIVYQHASDQFGIWDSWSQPAAPSTHRAEWA